MAASTATAGEPVGRKPSGFFWRHPRVRLSLLLAGPIGWLAIAYLGSLAVLFVAAFWHLDTFSGPVSYTHLTLPTKA